MNIIKKIFNITILLLLLVVIKTPIQASDFNITSSYNIYLKDIKNDFVTVEEEIAIQTNNSSYYIPKNSEQKFPIKKEGFIENSLSVTNKYGQNLNYTIEDGEKSFKLIIKNANDIKTSTPFFAKISYQTKDFVKQNGNNINLYLPGLDESIKFQEIDNNHNLVTTNTYLLKYHIPKESPIESFIFPKNITQSTGSNFRTYEFKQEDRLGQSGWIQLGTEQYFYFKVLQNVPKTDFVTPNKLSQYAGWISTNIVELTLPIDFEETNQKIFFSNLSPSPKKIKTDTEGNTVAIYELEANQDQKIIIEGYIKLSKSEKVISPFTTSEYLEKIKTLDNLEIYTQADKYWEIDNPLIKSKAQEIFEKNSGTTILDLIKANYNFVIEALDYSQEKAKGDNVRFGALKALQGAEAVCMEYADLMIALLRSQGIATRAAFGYGNDPLSENLTDSRIGHQWVQVWYPGYGWLSVDPTWGETGREYIGADLDHILWYTVANSVNRVSDSVIYSADSITSQTLKDYEVIINPLHKSEIPNLDELETISDIILKHSDENDFEYTELEYVLKTTMPGRIIIFIAPIVIILLAITSLSILISKIFKKKEMS
jgi:transglutaminase-like putative cysteine protease